MFLPQDAASLAQAFVDQGYEKTDLESIKVPAWREAAIESQPPNTQILSKKLRAERVLKPMASSHALLALWRPIRGRLSPSPPIQM